MPSVADNVRAALLTALSLTSSPLSTPDLERLALLSGATGVGKTTPDLRREQGKSQHRLYKDGAF